MLGCISDADHIAGGSASDEDRMALNKNAQFGRDLSFGDQQIPGMKVFGLADPVKYFKCVRGKAAEQPFLEEADPRKLAEAQ